MSMDKSKKTNISALYDKYSTEKETDIIFTSIIKLNPQLEDDINDFAKHCERQGFMAGFISAMQLLSECHL